MSSLFSSTWYRSAGVVPRLRSQARIFRHVYRGEVWHVVQDLASGKFLRLNPTAYRIVSLLDGLRTLDEVWRIACELLEDAAPSQDEVLQLMHQLHQTNLLATDRAPDLAELEERTVRSRKNRIKQYIANPMALRIPLIDPDRFLTRLVGLLPRWLWSVMLMAWFALMAMGISLAALHWDELTNDLARLVFTQEYILTLILVFPVLKAIHELGHGIAIKLFGGQCHEMGVMMLVFMPIPYVDASHASAFLGKYQRILVGAAGMMIELAVASVALWMWTLAEPGLFRVVLHDIVILAGVVTLLFNLNPLLRFDGYYILSDWLEIPNLGNKANQYLGHVLKRHLLQVRKGLQPPKVTAGEPVWLLGYSVLSFLYRMFIVTVIMLFVATQFFFIGVLLAAWAFYLMIVLPFGKTLKKALEDPALAEKRPRLYAVSMVTLLLALWLFTVQPFPAATVVEGVVWMPEHSQLRMANDCFGAEVLVRPGPVGHGEALLSCDDPQLHARYRELLARETELEAELGLARSRDRVLAQNIQSELIHVRQNLRDVERRIGRFTLHSPHAGEFVMPSPADFEGRWLLRGEIIGYVLDPARFTLLAVVPQGAADRMRRDLQGVEMRAVDDVWRGHPATVLREVPAATRELPSLALALEGGGRIGVAPPRAEGEKPRTLEPVFVVELALDQAEAFAQTLGSRVFVRLEHSPEPLTIQAWRVVREVFMRRFGV